MADPSFGARPAQVPRIRDESSPSARPGDARAMTAKRRERKWDLVILRLGIFGGMVFADRSAAGARSMGLMRLLGLMRPMETTNAASARSGVRISSFGF